jgi:hypothetical protein
MSDQVPSTFTTTFENNMRLALQQTRARLWPLLAPKTGTGAEKVQLDDIVGHTKSRKGSDDGRHGDVQYNNTPHSRVWVAKPDFDYYAELVDTNDQVQARIQLTSGYMQTAVATINRAMDDAVIAGLFGDMITGKDGTIIAPFPAGMITPADTGAAVATGLNIAKLRHARKIKQQAYNDPNEEAWMVVTADDLDQLLNEMPVTSKEFGAEGGELRDGRLRKLMGFEFIELETENPLFHNSALVDAGSGNRKTPWWVKSGMVTYSWWPLKTSIDILPQKHHARQVYASFCGVATRTDQGKVGYVLNKKN